MQRTSFSEVQMVEKSVTLSALETIGIDSIERPLSQCQKAGTVMFPIMPEVNAASIQPGDFTFAAFNPDSSGSKDRDEYRLRLEGFDGTPLFRVVYGIDNRNGWGRQGGGEDALHDPVRAGHLVKPRHPFFPGVRPRKCPRLLVEDLPKPHSLIDTGPAKKFMESAGKIALACAMKAC